MKVPFSIVAAAAILVVPGIARSQTLHGPESSAEATAGSGDATVADLLVLEPIVDAEAPFSNDPGVAEKVAPNQDTTLLDGLAGFIWTRTGEENKNYFASVVTLPTPAELQCPDAETDFDFPVELNDPANGGFVAFSLSDATASFASAPIQVQSVPEPTAKLLSLLGCWLLLGRRRR